MHKGGIKAVAIDTPGITLLFSFLVPATIPANPPNKAMNTSHIVGVVLANSSDFASWIGEMQKYKNETLILIIAATMKFFVAFLISSMSYIPIPSPIPIIGPMIGEISIAPITTAAEFTFKPIEAMKIAKIKTQRFVPLNSTFLQIDSIISRSSALSS